uniref:hypothetical protein n=1 Tax=Herbidospora sakaeratensis TaxID=564415 RepID=UPI000780684F|nr:hypothetical protein [Herbidospora sakaeratensis]
MTTSQLDPMYQLQRELRLNDALEKKARGKSRGPNAKTFVASVDDPTPDPEAQAAARRLIARLAPDDQDVILTALGLADDPDRKLNRRPATKDACPVCGRTGLRMRLEGVLVSHSPSATKSVVTAGQCKGSGKEPVIPAA